jgi:hypothetical protein
MGEEGSRRSSEITLPRSRYRGSIIVGSRKCGYGKRQVCAWTLEIPRLPWRVNMRARLSRLEGKRLYTLRPPLALASAPNAGDGSLLRPAGTGLCAG